MFPAPDYTDVKSSSLRLRQQVLIYKDTRPEVKAFLNWLLTDGQKYIHEYGFLKK